MEETRGHPSILYDLTVQTEWRPEPEALSRGSRDRASFTSKSAAINQSSTWSVLKNIGLAVSPTIPGYLPSTLTKLINGQINWKFCLTHDGGLLAILQENAIEVRCSENEFTTVRARWSLGGGRDAYPQWRCLAWSPDCTMLAVADSSTCISIYDEMGAALCQIPARTSGTDLSLALCSLIFKLVKNEAASDDTQHWFFELMAVNYQGALTSYLVSKEGDYKLHHTFNFGDYLSDGIGSVVYNPTHALLLIGGMAESPADSRHNAMSADQSGVSAWRVLSGSPHYKLVTNYETDLQPKVAKHKLVRRLSHWYSWSREAPADFVFKLSLSPNGALLASVHQSGRVSVWDLPSLRLKQTWPLDSQPGFDSVNEEVALNPKKSKSMKEFLRAFHLSDIGWWSDEALILARGTGAVTVSSVRGLHNLLGASPEWFEPGPLVTRASHSSFLGLECESKLVTPKRHVVNEDPGGAGSGRSGDREEDDSDDEHDATFGVRMSRYVTQGLYYVTDNERFQPQRKRVRFLSKTYRLICLRSTTPAELYARKIENEEYGEALLLAKTYGLDCDLVYQRQWRKAPVSVAAIQDYLSKISKRAWVLHECLERVTDDLDTMRELIQYGLRGTDLEALVAIGNRTDGGRFMYCDSDAIDRYIPLNDDADVDSDDDDEMETEAALASRLVRQRKADLLQQVDFTNLTLDQQELCRVRHKLLQFYDRLLTYQEILGGFHFAPEKFNAKYFERFRSQNIVELAVEYARLCRWDVVQAGDAAALGYIFSYHGADTLPHRLTILKNFPETCSPNEYRDLLPKAGSGMTDGAMIDWTELKWRPLDWSEHPDCFTAVSVGAFDLGDFLYESQPEQSQFKGRTLSKAQLSAWYALRATEIEQLSGQVDHALQLVSFAIEQNIPGLDDLTDDLLTMEILVYECRVDESLTFEQLREMPPLSRLRLMMNRTSEEMFVKNVRKWLVPFLRKCEQRVLGSFYALLQEYLVSMARDDLTLCLLVFKASKIGTLDPVIADQIQLMSIALECVYAYTGNDQLNASFEILVCLPQRGTSSDVDWVRLHDQLDLLENHLRGAEILEANGLPQTVDFVRSTKSNKEEAVKLFMRIMRTAARREPALGEQKLKKILQDLCELRDKVYSCISKELCYEIFVESLLCSGALVNIGVAGRMVHCTARNDPEQTPPSGVATSDPSARRLVAYDRAVELVLLAAREYFDSSATLNDSDMELARACLYLITDHHSAIEEEKDLIEAVGMLEGFGVSILPVQVRMHPSRLQLVQKAIAARPSTYKGSQRLLKLGRLLRIGGASEADTNGQVLGLVAQAALKCNDYKTAYEACSQQMAAGYCEAWIECRALAEASDYTDIHAKSSLLAFAVSHCPPELIESILKARAVLQIEMLHDQVQSRMPDRDSTSPPNPASTPPTRPALTHDLIESTNKATRAVLSHIGNKKWWKNALSGLRPAEHRPGGVGADGFDDLNAGFLKLGCHPFYETLYESCYVNKTDVDYSAMTRCRADQSAVYLHESLLRTAKLEETIADCDSSDAITEVLLLLAEDILAQDTLQGLAYLLALHDPCRADDCFTKVAGTTASLQLAVYYYALQLCAWLRWTSQPLLEDAYRWQPCRLSRVLLGYVQAATAAEKNAEWPEQVQRMVQRLLYHNEQLLDYTQAQSLQRLNRGVDISRFVREETYKKETILGMVMSSEPDVFNTAISLAKRYRLHMPEVYMTHLEALFDDEAVSTEQIEGRVAQLGILPELTKDGATFLARMLRNVYPLIDGTDTDRLLLYYILLSEVPAPAAPSLGGPGGAAGPSKGAQGAVEGAMGPADRVKLLRKLKGSAPGINYKHLTDGSRVPLDVLRPFLTADNVNTIAKLASGLCNEDGSSLHASSVYRVWAAKLFTEGQQGKKTNDATVEEQRIGLQPKAPRASRERQLKKVERFCTGSLAQNRTAAVGPKSKLLDMFAKSKAIFQPNEESEWLHRYELCSSELMPKMSTDDILLFIHDITFTKTAVVQLEVECRRQVVRRALKFVRQQQSAKKKRTDCVDTVSWDELVRELQRSLDHLDRVDSPAIQDMKSSFDQQLRDYATRFDLTRSDSKMLETLLMSVVLDSQSPEVVDTLLGAAGPSDCTVSGVVRKVLQTVVNSLRQPESAGDVMAGRNLVETLHSVVDKVQKHQDCGGELVSRNVVAEVLRPFCADPRVSSQTRLVVLQILEQTLKVTEKEDDSSFLLLHRSQAIVSTIGASSQISAHDLATNQSRLALFNRLLLESKHLPQFAALGQLLLAWPKLDAEASGLTDPADTQSSSLCTAPWCRLVTHMLRESSEESVAQVLSCTNTLHRAQDLSIECTRHITDYLLKTTPASLAAAATCLLSSSHQQLYAEAIQIIKLIPQDLENDNLFDLILQRHLLPLTVAAPIFSRLGDFLLISQQADESATPQHLRIETAANELQEAGYQSEAGTLLMRHHATHPCLRTFDAAHSVLARLFRR